VRNVVCCAIINAKQIDKPGSSTIYGTLPTYLNQHNQPNPGGPVSLELVDDIRARTITNSTEPLATEVDVFTAKVRTSDESLLPTQSDGIDCLRCQLWNIINPDGNIRCDNCTVEGFETLEAVIGATELPKTTTAAPRHDVLKVTPSENFPQPKSTGRCSACEISAFIHPGQPVNCASCTLNTGLLSPTPSDQPSKVKRSCARRPPTKLESHATRCLQRWLKEHRNDPYPDTETKRSLAEKCGITEKQVNTWFTNARARKRVVGAKSSNPASEDEGARNTRLSSVVSTALSHRDASSGFEAPSNRQYSITSHCAGDDPSHTTTSSSRRGKKKNYGQSANVSTSVSKAQSFPSKSQLSSTDDYDSESQAWQCTFCYQHIARKSWRRHEETQHRPKRKWTCLHTGPSITTSSRSDASTSCVFCMAANPSDKHFADCHRIAECMAKDENERTFLRPDHLRQHIKNFHKAKLDETIRDLWRREGPDGHAVENWVCGFCAKVLKTWDDRETHIASHFKDGLIMADWKGNTRQDAEASKKRPTSSEGRPNVLSKLARTLTFRSSREQHHYESQSQGADAFDDALTFIRAPELDAPLLPELVFDDFMAGVGDVNFDYGDAILTSAYEHDFASAERHGSAFPDEGITGFDFGDLVDEFVNQEFGNGDAFGLWYQ